MQAMPRPAPRVAPATKAIFPANGFFFVSIAFIFRLLFGFRCFKHIYHPRFKSTFTRRSINLRYALIVDASCHIPDYALGFGTLPELLEPPVLRERAAAQSVVAFYTQNALR